MKQALPILFLLILLVGCNRRFAFRNTIKVHNYRTLHSQEVIKHNSNSPNDMPGIAYAESGVVDKNLDKLVDTEAALVVQAERQTTVNREETQHETKINHPPKHCTIVLTNDPAPGKAGDRRYNTHSVIGFILCVCPLTSTGILGIAGLVLCIKGLKSERDALARAGIAFFVIWTIVSLMLLLYVFTIL